MNPPNACFCEELLVMQGRLLKVHIVKPTNQTFVYLEASYLVKFYPPPLFCFYFEAFLHMAVKLHSLCLSFPIKHRCHSLPNTQCSAFGSVSGTSYSTEKQVLDHFIQTNQFV